VSATRQRPKRRGLRREGASSAIRRARLIALRIWRYTRHPLVAPAGKVVLPGCAKNLRRRARLDRAHIVAAIDLV
jgi:hypothetical protein